METFPELYFFAFIKAGDEPLYNNHYKSVIKAGALPLLLPMPTRL